MDDLAHDGFGHWLAGFVDGEGCFVIYRRSSGSYACRLAIEVREDELATLQQITARLGFGTYVSVNRDVGWPLVRWQVSGREHCERLCEVFELFPLRAKKAHDYAYWRAAVRAWGEQDWPTMASLKLEMSQQRGYVAVA